ncbi:hypothetical protein [Paractinoplanes atraurantiacus]|uniref:Uncharacterized protein n=1 Tax=Paractinoplanes atraurantiacus TaxID=1036182 RepID=A0A285J557_9ACTN|nr:hypothetical protein [Actinoplanes atraurantiacus]SNY55414.1 hypothetical protein SAMN05421748_116135 [Actinoplanes atraurantiacus]
MPPQPAEAEPRAPESDEIKRNLDDFVHRDTAPETGPARPDTSWEHGKDGADLGPDRSYRVKTDGGYTTIGDNARTYVYNLRNGREVAIVRYQRSPDWFTRADEVFVRPGNYQHCYDTLTEHRLLYLCGPPGSGRRLFAEMLLRRAAGPDRVCGLQVSQTDLRLTALAGETDLLADYKAFGVVLELASPGPVEPATLAALAGIATQAEAFMVVLGEPGADLDQPLYPYDAAIEPASAQEVFRRHLLYELRKRAERGDSSAADPTELVRRCREHEEVKKRLTADPLPGAVADLARALAAWDGTDAALKPALNRIRARVRELAARLVKGDGKTVESPPTPRRQAVQIAHAAFDGHPLTDVFEAGQLLFAILDHQASGGADRSRALFDADVDHMLRLPDGTVLTRLKSTDNPRRVYFVDPGFAAEVLDVVWNDFDSVRLPLLFWLHRLVEDERPALKRRAAYTAGALATRDFDEVLRLLIRPWARSGSGVQRQAAAWAIDALADEGRLLWRVRALVRDWTRSRSPQLHDSAARAYGTSLGAALPEDALADLHVLASRNDLNGSASVAYAMKFLYSCAPEPTGAALLSWNTDRFYRVRVHAARSLIILAQFAAPAPRQQWPILLADLEPQDLADLWRGALAGPTTMRRAWNELGIWMRCADVDAEIAARVVELGRLIVADWPYLDDRGRFYLRQWRQNCATAAQIYDMLPGDRP